MGVGCIWTAVAAGSAHVRHNTNLHGHLTAAAVPQGCQVVPKETSDGQFQFLAALLLVLFVADAVLLLIGRRRKPEPSPSGYYQ